MCILQLYASIAIYLHNFVPVEFIIALSALLQVVDDYSRSSKDISYGLAAL